MKVFKRIIGKSQAHYLVNKMKNIGINDQCSYNLRIELKDYLLEHNAIRINSSIGDSNHVVYELNTEWSFSIDESVLEIIGNDYSNRLNKIIFVYTTDKNGNTPKFQLMRTYFKDMKSIEYNWFIDLYNNNFVGAEISITVNEEESNVTISNRIIVKDESGDDLFDNESPNDLTEEAHGVELVEYQLPITIFKDGKNEIYYGAPGCGKSYFVKEKYEKPENIVLRTTFHPEYSNSDFIGQIIPKVDEDGNVVYQFNPGIFTNALIDALNFGNKKIILIIEEINRGNASSIFGDIFQLLDRDSNGNSIYEIHNDNLVQFINKNIKGKIKNIYIPANLSIIATMNTSDQNISPLDTAFKRRWNLVKIKNTFTTSNSLSKLYVPMTDITWKDFVEKVNTYLIDNAEQLNIFGEDKCLGVYFVGKNELSNIPNDESEDGLRANKLFSEKVLFYIWNDIAKLSPLLWFSPEYKTFDSVIEGFEKNGIDIFIGSIFGRT